MDFVWQTNQDIGAAYRRVLAATTRGDLATWLKYEQALATYSHSISDYYQQGRLEEVVNDIFPRGQPRKRARELLTDILKHGGDRLVQLRVEAQARGGFRDYDARPAKTRSRDRRFW